MNAYRTRRASGRRAAASKSASQSEGIFSTGIDAPMISGLPWTAPVQAAASRAGPIQRRADHMTCRHMILTDSSFFRSPDMNVIKLTILGILSAAIATLPATSHVGAPPRVADKVALAATPFPLEAVRLLDGPFKQAMQLDQQYL